MTRLLIAFAVSCALLLPSSSALAFDASKPDEVSIAFLPFEPEREEDAAISFLLEDYVQANLGRKIRHPVVTGPALQPALLQGVDACVSDADCLELLGAQFNASIVVRALVFRSGSELQLDTEWFTTGNGVRVGRERVNFEPGEERQMVDALANAFQTYFDTSLRVTRANRAGEGGVVTEADDEDDRLAEYRSRKEKRVSSRRSDFDAEPDDAGFDRSDPTGDLRALVGDEEDEEEPPRKQKKVQRRREEYGGSATGGDEYSDDEGEAAPRKSTRSNRSSSGRSAAPVGDDMEEDIALADDEPSGRSVATYAQAQREGYGKREYDRYVNSGQTFGDFHASRWSLGKRFGIRLGGVYGLGYVTRRYASTIFIRVGGVKTDEYAWERLGFAPATGGINLGVSIAPADVFGIEADFSILVGQQDLRREYDSDDQGNNIGQVEPESQATAHVGIDIVARAFIFPKRRVKLSPGFGATILVMSGYDFDDASTGQLEYTERPTTAVIGLTPVVGVRIALTQFLHAYIDLSGTAFVHQGDAYYEEHQLFGTVEPRLANDRKQVPVPVIPLMARLGGGVQIMF